VSLITGLLAGFFGGLLGIGGGVVMIPMMVGILKASQRQAHGTSLAALVFIGLAGSISYGLKGSVDLPASILLASTAAITAYAGAHYSNTLPEWKLKRYFGFFLVFVAATLLLKPYVTESVFVLSGTAKVLVLLLVGMITGILAGMIGVGGGAVMIPAAVIFLGFDQHTAQGSSLLTMVPMGIIGAWTHFRLGNVKVNILGGLITGVLAGAYLGSSTAHLLDEALLRFIFGIVLLWTGIRSIRKSRPANAEENT
jgi:uncharacterized protein